MSWIERLIDRILKLFPRIFLVNPNEGGIRVTLGTRVKLLDPGWYLYLGLFQTVEKIDVKQQVVDLRPQSVRTKDGQDMTISGAIKYKVVDVCKAILDVLDYDKNIQVLALGIIQEHVAQHRLEDINGVDLANKVLNGLREAAQGWGLKLQLVRITDIGRTRNIRLLTNPSSEVE